jgi:hypothetical protein
MDSSVHSAPTWGYAAASSITVMVSNELQSWLLKMPLLTGMIAVIWRTKPISLAQNETHTNVSKMPDMQN